MFYVYEHRYGRPGQRCANGGVWETGLGGHKWTCVSQHGKKADAMVAADASATHAVVQYSVSNPRAVYDNGKAPLGRVQELV